MGSFDQNMITQLERILSGPNGSLIYALLLAGRRSADDPLAEAAGAPHRALLDIGGVPMLERVLRTLVATQPGEAVPSVLDFDADLDDLLHDGPRLSADFSRDDIYAEHD